MTKKKATIADLDNITLIALRLSYYVIYMKGFKDGKASVKKKNA